MSTNVKRVGKHDLYQQIKHIMRLVFPQEIIWIRLASLSSTVLVPAVGTLVNETLMKIIFLDMDRAGAGGV